MKAKKHSSPPTSAPKQDSRRPADTGDISRSMLDNIHISPEKRICPSYDYLSIASYRVATPNKMGFRVVDNCAEEHMM